MTLSSDGAPRPPELECKAGICVARSRSRKFDETIKIKNYNHDDIVRRYRKTMTRNDDVDDTRRQYKNDDDHDTTTILKKKVKKKS